MNCLNVVQLIIYVDWLGGGDIKVFNVLFNEQLKGVFGGVYLLFFFYFIDGEDVGFDFIDYIEVDRWLGNWQDVGELGENMDIMVDMIVNYMFV